MKISPYFKISRVITTCAGHICQLPSIEAYENVYPIGVQKIYLTLQQIKEPTAWVRQKICYNLDLLYPIFTHSGLISNYMFVMHFG